MPHAAMGRARFAGDLYADEFRDADEEPRSMDDAPDAEFVRKLLEIGYVAAGNGRFVEAEAIFRGVAAARPESSAPTVGRAVAALNRNAPGEAVALLQSAAQRFDGDDLVRAFLGLALQLAGRNAESVEILRAVADSADPAAANLARTLLTPNPGA